MPSDEILWCTIYVAKGEVRVHDIGDERHLAVELGIGTANPLHKSTLAIARYQESEEKPGLTSAYDIAELYAKMLDLPVQEH